MEYTVVYGERTNVVQIENLALNSAKYIVSSLLRMGEEGVEIRRQKEEDKSNNPEMWDLYSDHCNKSSEALDFCRRAEDYQIKQSGEFLAFVGLFNSVLQGHNEMLQKTARSKEKMKRELEETKWRRNVNIAIWMALYGVIFIWAVAKGQELVLLVLAAVVNFPSVFLAIDFFYRKRVRNIEKQLTFSKLVHFGTAVVVEKLVEIEDAARRLEALNDTCVGMSEPGPKHDMHTVFIHLDSCRKKIHKFKGLICQNFIQKGVI